ncbi:MAG: response regulator [Candidatus Cloacimonetes bacterium]|nr:response regulator [Candidatus Cloacimonadota bacterium]
MKRTILCIDDELFIRESVGFWLEDRGYQVITAHNGRLGLDLFMSQKPDLVLLDLCMPDMDGFEFLGKIKKLISDIPVIVISGTGRIADVVEAQNRGAWQYIMKPMHDFNMLAHAMKQCFEKVDLIQENRRYKEHLEKKVEERTAQLTLLNSLSEDVLGEIDFDQICYKISLAAKEMLGAEHALILYTEKAGFVHFPATDKMLISEKVIERLARLALKESEEIVLSDPELGWVLIAPVVLDSKRMGVLVISRKELEFTQEDSQVISRLASIYLLAVQRRSLESKVQREQQNASMALKVKSTFLSQMSHELRTPLTGTMGMLELIQNTTTLEDSHRFAVEGSKSARELLELINRILQFCNLAQQEFQPEFCGFSPSEQIIQVCLGFIEDAHQKGLKLRWIIDSSVPELFVNDPLALRQILHSLVDNAVKFSDSGEILVRAWYLPDEKILKFVIEDQGPGIDPANQDVIFEHFTQLEEVYTRVHGGAGLGLALVKRLVDHIGGKVWVESQPGTGSRFFVDLPQHHEVV